MEEQNRNGSKHLRRAFCAARGRNSWNSPKHWNKEVLTCLSEKDYQRSFLLCLEYAYVGFPSAQFTLAAHYRNGWYVEEDEEQSVYWCQEAAKQGLIPAMMQLAYHYMNGIGVGKDEHTAFALYKAVIEEGIDHPLVSTAYYKLGECYEHGIATEPDNARAFECYLKAAKVEDAKTIEAVARCYENSIGVDKDIEQAAFWRQKLASSEGS